MWYGRAQDSTVLEHKNKLKSIVFALGYPSKGNVLCSTVTIEPADQQPCHFIRGANANFCIEHPSIDRIRLPSRSFRFAVVAAQPIRRAASLR